MGKIGIDRRGRVKGLLDQMESIYAPEEEQVVK